MKIRLYHADMLGWLRAYAAKIEAGDAEPFDSAAMDPPYHLASIVKRFGKPSAAPCKEGATGAYARASRGFMGKEWDGGNIAFRTETWELVFACLKPGAHLVAFSGTRTYHRMACAIEDAGFEIRDQLAWAYGSGFPKSHDTAKALRAIWPQPRNQSRAEWKAERREIRCAARAYDGHGTALKPAWEPICLARKPLSEGSVAANVLKWGTGALNIDGCRIEGGAGVSRRGEPSKDRRYSERGSTNFAALPGPRGGDAKGRWPANIVTDGSDEVVAAFPDSKGQQGIVTGNEPSSPFANVYGDMPNRAGRAEPRGDSGSAARFFYSAKAGPLDRLGSKHATVKPVDLMRWIVRLVTPPGGHVLDAFAGSGTTGIACLAEGMACTMIEMEAEHCADIRRKLAILRGEGRLKVEEHKQGRLAKKPSLGPLFGDAA